MFLRYRWEQAQYREDSRSALVACAIYNVNRTKGRKAFEVSDLIGHPPGAKKSVAGRPGANRMSGQSMLNKVIMLNSMFGGVDKRKAKHDAQEQ